MMDILVTHEGDVVINLTLEQVEELMRESSYSFDSNRHIIYALCAEVLRLRTKLNNLSRKKR